MSEESEEAAEGSSAPRSRTERFDQWVRHSPPILLLGLGLFLFVTIGGAIHFSRSAINWYHRTYDWRSAEYARLKQLHSDFTLAAFEGALGPPLFEDESLPDHRWKEYLFHRRGYWVQALTRKSGNTVEAYAVTACDPSFRPTFHFQNTKVTLNQSRLSDPRPALGGVFSYALPATEPPWFYATSEVAGATNQQAFAWGDDADCAFPSSQHLRVPARFNEHFGGTMNLARVPTAFSRALPINTFAAWGPTDDTWPNSAFHIGVDQQHIEALQSS